MCVLPINLHREAVDVPLAAGLLRREEAAALDRKALARAVAEVFGEWRLSRSWLCR